MQTFLLCNATENRRPYKLAISQREFLLRPATQATDGATKERGEEITGERETSGTNGDAGKQEEGVYISGVNTRSVME